MATAAHAERRRATRMRIARWRLCSGDSARRFIRPHLRVPGRDFAGCSAQAADSSARAADRSRRGAGRRDSHGRAIGARRHGPRRADARGRRTAAPRARRASAGAGGVPGAGASARRRRRGLRHGAAAAAGHGDSGAAARGQRAARSAPIRKRSVPGCEPRVTEPRGAAFCSSGRLLEDLDQLRRRGRLARDLHLARLALRADVELLHPGGIGKQARELLDEGEHGLRARASSRAGSCSRPRGAPAPWRARRWPRPRPAPWPPPACSAMTASRFCHSGQRERDRQQQRPRPPPGRAARGACRPTRARRAARSGSRSTGGCRRRRRRRAPRPARWRPELAQALHALVDQVAPRDAEIDRAPCAAAASRRRDAIAEVHVLGAKRREAVHLEGEHLRQVLLGGERQRDAAQQRFLAREAQAHAQPRLAGAREQVAKREAPALGIERGERRARDGAERAAAHLDQHERRRSSSATSGAREVPPNAPKRSGTRRAISPLHQRQNARELLAPGRQRAAIGKDAGSRAHQGFAALQVRHRRAVR